MSALDLFSEPFHAAGSIDARAARRAIGRPTLDPWSLFLRETLQNSWDARSSASGPIDFSVDGWWATRSQLRTLRNEVFAAKPQRGLDLAAHLSEEDVPLLLITDRRTRGLTGPTRADLTANERADFVHFVRNVGRDEAKGYGGGTYGFGKGVLYDASNCATVLVFTRTHIGRTPVNRFIAMALGSAFDARGKRYTGRHWWGVEDRTTGVEPLTGRKAESLARALGMDTVPANTTGTAIMVLAPVAHDDETLEEIIERIAYAATQWAWPHMLPNPKNPSIRFSFSHDGDVLRAPDPLADPVLSHYADAYVRGDAVLTRSKEPGEEWPWFLRSIRSERPSRRLGVLAYRRYRPEIKHKESIFGDFDSHVALMRDPRFIVRYMPVQRDPSGLATAGVFVADPDLNDEFAMAEPLAHEDWVPENMRLEKYTRNPVKQALEKLKAEFRQSVRSVSSPGGQGRFAGVAKLSSFMGPLLEGSAEGVDAGTPIPTDGASGGDGSGGGRAGRSSGSGGRHRREVSIEVLGRPTLRLIDDTTVAEFAVAVKTRERRLQLTAIPRVVVDSGATEGVADAPVGAATPRVIGWVTPTGRVDTGDSIMINPHADGSYVVRVHQPEDTAVTVSITDVERP